MSRRFAFAIGASTALNLSLVAWGCGAFVQFLIVVPLVAVSIVSLAYGLHLLESGAAKATRRQAQSVIAFAAVAGSCLLSLPIGSLVNRYEIDQAKRYCERLRPALDRYHRTHGRYPDQLRDISLREPRPRLLERAEFYRGRDQVYEFSIADPSRIFAGYEFTSQHGMWYYWD